MNPETNAKQCSCGDGFVENSIGHCEIAWGNPCTNDGKPFLCDTIAGLRCRNGLCACPDTMSYFNSSLRKCVGLVGSRCKNYGVGGDHGEACVTNATCIQTHPRIAGTCLCNDGYSVTNEMLCTKTESEAVDVLDDLTENEVEIEDIGSANSTVGDWDRP